MIRSYGGLDDLGYREDILIHYEREGFLCVLTPQDCKHPGMETVEAQVFEVVPITSIPAGYPFEGTNRRSKSISSGWLGGKITLLGDSRSAAAVGVTRQCIEEPENQQWQIPVVRIRYIWKVGPFRSP